MASPTIQFKRGSAGVAGTVPALKPGEPAFSTNNFDFFIGFDTSVTGNKFFGSHRYWTREDGSRSAGLNLVDQGGSNYLQLKAPESLSGIGTYTLPDTNSITSGYYLKVLDTDGTLGWANVSSGAEFTNATLLGITTIGPNVDDRLLDVDVYAEFAEGINVSGITTIATADINGGNIDGTTIGAGTSAAGTFTDLVGTAATVTNLTINNSTPITDIDTDLTTAGSHETLASALAIKTYVDTKVGLSTLTFEGDSGGSSSIDLDSQTFTIAGTTNEIETSSSGQTLTIGLPDAVEITTSLSVGAGVTISASGINAETGIVTATTFVGSFDGNAGTATSLATARTIAIGGEVTGSATSFDGTANITIDADLNITGLTSEASLANSDEFVVYDVTAAANRKTSALDVSNYAFGRVSGDILIGSDGVAAIQADSVALGTDTTGNYVEDVTAGDGLAKTSSASEGQTVDLSVNVGTGITIASDAVTLKGADSLTDEFLPAWDDANGQLVNSGTSYSVGGGTTITGNLHVTGTANIGSISGTAATATRATTVDTTGTTTDSTYFMLFADTSAGEEGETVRVSAAASLNPNGTGTFSVGTIQAGSIKSTTGSNAITINTSGSVETASDLTVAGNLIVNGTTTQVNTSEITVEDRTIELGVVGGSLPTDTTWDLGILMNYGDAGVGKTSAVIWEASSARFVLASNLTEAVGITTNLPQITPSGYAGLEIGELWINNTCTSNSSTKVISCSGSDLVLENIIVDGGTF